MCLVVNKRSVQTYIAKKEPSMWTLSTLEEFNVYFAPTAASVDEPTLALATGVSNST